MGVKIVATIQSKRYVNKHKYHAHEVTVEHKFPGCVTLEWEEGALLFEYDDLKSLMEALQVELGEKKQGENYAVWRK